MPDSPESLLLAVLAALYVYDSSLLLHRNEALMMETGRGTWKAVFPYRFGSFFGKELCLPGLLNPTRPAFRLAWSYVAPGRGAARSWTESAALFRPFRLWTSSLLAVMFGLLPIVLLRRLGDMAILAVFVLMYLHVIAVCTQLWRHRELLRLKPRQVASLAFEFLVCPPFAVNVVKRLALVLPVPEDFLLAAERLLPPGDLPHVHKELVLRLDDEIAAEDDGTPRMQALVERRGLLAQACPQ